MTGFAKLMMVVAVVAVAGSTTAWAQDSCPASFTTPLYSPDFSNTSDQLCLTLNGNYNGAANTSYPAFESNDSTWLRLTPNVGTWATSAWFNTPQTVATGFSTQFQFRIGQTSGYNADGFAFVVQNSEANSYYGTTGTGALANPGCAVGFAEDSAYGFCAPLTGGIPNSVAVQFKTYDNDYPAAYPNTANSVSIMSALMGANCINYSCAIAVNNSLQVAGTVSTNGNTVTWVSGSLFSTSWAPGATILINGVAYTISSVTNTTTLTLSTNAGTLSVVPYSFGAPVAGTVNTSGNTVTWVSGSYFNPNWDLGTQILINGTAYTITSGPLTFPGNETATTTTTLTVTPNPPALMGVPYSVGIILDDGNVHTVTITYTLTPTLSVSPNCFSETSTAEPCLDVILDGVDLFSGGVYFNLTAIGLAGGTNAYVGFTGGNAGGNDDEDILDWTFGPQSQSQSGTVTPGQTSPTVLSFNGGCNPNANGDCTNSGYDLTLQETSAAANQAAQVVVTAIPIISGTGTSPAANQTLCNAIVQANSLFDTYEAPAQCFVIQNGGGQGVDAPVFFQIECPQSTGYQCGTSENLDFYATIGAAFSFSCTENPSLGALPDGNCIEPGNSGTSFGFPNITSLTSLPEIGFLKGSGPDSTQACASIAEFQSNQILSFLLGPGDNGGGGKAGSGGGGSCWTVTYQTQPEGPYITLTTPSPGQMISAGTMVAANYTCTADTTVTVVNPNPTTGPYLTITSCTGTVASGSDISTSTPGPNTFTVNAEDDADNTNTQTVTYYVVGSQAITFTIPAPSSAAYNSMFTVAATGGASGNPVVFTSSGACTNVGATYTMTNSTGTCSVIANQAGTPDYYYAAPQVTETVTATGPLVSATIALNLPSTVYLGSILPAVVEVTNNGTLTLDFNSLSLTLGGGTPPADFTIVDKYAPYILCSSTLAPGKTCYAVVVFYASEIGTPSATFNIADNAPGSPQQFIFSTTVINPQVKFTPSSLSFGTIKHTTTSTLNVTLSNPGTTPLIINSNGIGITGTNAGNFTQTNNCPISPSSLAVNGSCTIAVKFTPGAVGTFSANVTVSDNALGSPQGVPLSGKGD